MKNIRRQLILLQFLMLIGSHSVHAQGTDPASDLAMVITVGMMAAVIAVLMYIIVVKNSNVDPIAALYLRVKNYIIPPPGEAAPDVGHIYDDIRELDNRIPPWFNYLFALTVVFAVVYMVDYHVIGSSKLSEAEYTDEMIAADLQRKIMLASGGTINENALVVLTDETSLKEGAENYHKFCVSCHGPQGGGLVGPNLTDDYWIHGGGITDVYMTIKKGVPSKGMISWELVFSQKQIQNISSYVLSLHGTNPPGGKASEGEFYQPPVALQVDSANAAAGK